VAENELEISLTCSVERKPSAVINRCDAFLAVAFAEELRVYFLRSRTKI